ncbi:MAG: hypothetical protein ABI321_16895 [Polyangia bacterium]
MKLALVAPLLVLAPHVAQACSPLGCVPGFFFPANGTSVPAAPPALVLQPSIDYPTSTSTIGDPHLTKDGVDVPFSIVPDGTYGDVLIVPSKPLSSGTYVMTRSEACSKAEPTLKSATITVGDAAAMPQTIGVLSASVMGRTSVLASNYPSSYSCVDYTEASLLALSLVPSAELVAWRALVRYDVQVDGETWATSEYGAVFDATPELYSRTVYEIFAGCNLPAGSTQYRAGVTPGTHHAVLSAHVAGAITDPMPIAFDFSLTCAATVPTDGFVPIGDAGVTAPLVKSSGCSFGGNGARVPWLLLPLLALALRRRRLRP